ncbi:hypothetical protein [Corynebacterium sp. KPL4043]|uniref:hypothetical protein n=1 Tax=Corynebacterium sp. KPL4043 TaxID=3158328 RepID=UPI0032ED00C4
MGQLNPTRQEILKAYASLFGLADFAVTQAEDKEQADMMRAYNDHILKALPPKPRPTMAEIEWDTDKHFLAEAEHEDGSDTIMLWKTTSGCISIIRNGLVGAVYPDSFTPTGRRYVLQEGE